MLGRLAIVGLIVGVIGLVWLVASTAGGRERTIRVEGEGLQGQDLRLVTLLPFDAIRSIDAPAMVSRAEADSSYSDDELVLGVSINGDVRAYSVPLLSSREIVNDVVGGEPVAITW